MRNVFKMRAECAHDIGEFYKALDGFKPGDFVLVQGAFPLPDVELTFTTDKTLSQIKTVLSGITDSHVMLETVQPIELYTGERR